MTVVVGYAATPEGRAALSRAADEALLRASDLVVVNSSRSRDGGVEGESSRVDCAGVSRGWGGGGVRVAVSRLGEGPEPADALIATAEELGASVLVIGLRRRSP